MGDLLSAIDQSLGKLTMLETRVAEAARLIDAGKSKLRETPTRLEATLGDMPERINAMRLTLEGTWQSSVAEATNSRQAATSLQDAVHEMQGEMDKREAAVLAHLAKAKSDIQSISNTVREQQSRAQQIFAVTLGRARQAADAIAQTMAKAEARLVKTITQLEHDHVALQERDQALRKFLTETVTSTVVAQLSAIDRQVKSAIEQLTSLVDTSLQKTATGFAAQVQTLDENVRSILEAAREPLERSEKAFLSASDAISGAQTDVVSTCGQVVEATSSTVPNAASLVEIPRELHQTLRRARIVN